MKLKNNLSKELIIIGIIFLVIIIIFSFISFRLNNSINKTIEQSKLPKNAMEHMLTDVYQDHLILIDYLDLVTYVSAIKKDDIFLENDEVCDLIETEVEYLISSGFINNKELLNDYYNAVNLHDQVETIRDQIIELHKLELATSGDYTVLKNSLIQNHTIILKQAVNQFSTNINKINVNNDKLRNDLQNNSNLFVIFIIISINSFIIVIILKIKKYENKELYLNQNNQEPKLLRKEYIQIIEYLKTKDFAKTKTTIKDLKSHLSITHPTVLSRIEHLKNLNFITIEKVGREKYIELTIKGKNFKV
jgi:hypothetical protein